MNSKKHLMTKVIGDRKSGLSLGELSRKYGLAKSTLSLWCNKVPLSREVKKSMKKKWLESTASARSKGTLRNKQKRLDSIEKETIEARAILGSLSQRDELIMGLGLYWAEGSKKETGSGFSFINSDPTMIKFMYAWLLNNMSIKKDMLIISLSINEVHKKREGEILKFWSNLLDFPLRDFGNTVFIKTPHKRVYNNQLTYQGMLRIKVRSSSWLRRRILGAIKIFNENTSA